MRIFLHLSLGCGVQTAGPFFKFIVVRLRVRVQFFWVGVVRVRFLWVGVVRVRVAGAFF